MSCVTSNFLNFDATIYYTIKIEMSIELGLVWFRCFITQFLVFITHFSVHKHKPTNIWDNIWFKQERKVCWAKIVLCFPWNGFVFVFDDIWFNHGKHKHEKKFDSSETRMSHWFWRERKVAEQWSLGCV